MSAYEIVGIVLWVGIGLCMAALAEDEARQSGDSKESSLWQAFAALLFWPVAVLAWLGLKALSMFSRRGG